MNFIMKPSFDASGTLKKMMLCFSWGVGGWELLRDFCCFKLCICVFLVAGFLFGKR